MHKTMLPMMAMIPNMSSPDGAAVNWKFAAYNVVASDRLRAAMAVACKRRTIVKRMGHQIASYTSSAFSMMSTVKL